MGPLDEMPSAKVRERSSLVLFFRRRLWGLAGPRRCKGDEIPIARLASLRVSPLPTWATFNNRGLATLLYQRLIIFPAFSGINIIIIAGAWVLHFGIHTIHASKAAVLVTGYTYTLRRRTSESSLHGYGHGHLQEH